MALTRRQKEFLDFLVGFTDSNGYSPSYEEIASALDLASLATVHKHVAALEMKGYLRRGFNQSRSLEVSPKYLQEFKRSEDCECPSGRGSATRAHCGRLTCRSHSGNRTAQLSGFRCGPEHVRARSPRRIDDRRSHLQR